jgi:6-pyruvoyltetrahydropterin/6-carboxytetrahydropterin synthase
MLSKHPEACRFPHGHTRRIEVVVASESLDERDMVLDFKALRLALEEYIDRYDHSLAVNSSEALLPSLETLYPSGVVVFENQDPTTEVLARDIFEYVAGVLRVGFVSERYAIPAGSVRLERVRVWETPSSWAEYGE